MLSFIDTLISDERVSLQWRHNGVVASQLTSLTMFTKPFIRAQTKESIKAPRHWPLCGEFTGDRWMPAQIASNAENVSIWWRHHVSSNIQPWYWPCSPGISRYQHNVISKVHWTLGRALEMLKNKNVRNTRRTQSCYSLTTINLCGSDLLQILCPCRIT